MGIYVLLGLVEFLLYFRSGGIGYVLQPTFGYLIGFIVGAWVTGKVRERLENHIQTYVNCKMPQE